MTRPSTLAAAGALGVAVALRLALVAPASPPLVAVDAPPPPDLVLPHPGFVEAPFTAAATARALSGRCPRALVAELHDASGGLVRREPSPLPLACLGETRAHRLVVAQSALAAPLPAGRYEVGLVYRDPTSGHRERLVRRGDGGRGEKRLRIAEINVPETPAPAVDLRFGRGWAPPEAGDDGTVRRTFERRADLVVTGDRDGELYLALDVPPTDRGHVQSPDPRPPARMVVRWACPVDTRRALTGAGRHEVVLPMPGGAPCVVTLRARYALALPDEVPRSGTLAALAWRPAARRPAVTPTAPSPPPPVP